jgi:hypothetical protein
MTTAVLDACVLYPPSLRDLLMRLATSGIYAHPDLFLCALIDDEPGEFLQTVQRHRKALQSPPTVPCYPSGRWPYGSRYARGSAPRRDLTTYSLTSRPHSAKPENKNTRKPDIDSQFTLIIATGWRDACITD